MEQKKVEAIEELIECYAENYYLEADEKIRAVYFYDYLAGGLDEDSTITREDLTEYGMEDLLERYCEKLLENGDILYWEWTDRNHEEVQLVRPIDDEEDSFTIYKKYKVDDPSDMYLVAIPMRLDDCSERRGDFNKWKYELVIDPITAGEHFYIVYDEESEGVLAGDYYLDEDEAQDAADERVCYLVQDLGPYSGGEVCAYVEDIEVPDAEVFNDDCHCNDTETREVPLEVGDFGQAGYIVKLNKKVFYN